MDLLEVVRGARPFGEYLADLVIEADKGSVVSFSHKGQKKKGIVIGTKGEALVVARGSERHMVKNGESKRMMEAAEEAGDPLEELAPEVLSEAQMDLIAEQMADGAVDLCSPVLLERLTPRQLKFLFATGAFAAGKAAARTVSKTSAGGTRIQVSGKGMGNFSGSKEFPQFKRPAVRAAAKQAMQQHIKAYKALKREKLIGLKMASQEKMTGKPGSRNYLPMTNILRMGRVNIRDVARRLAGG